jgi:DNA-binding response OmpR family regulator
LQMLEQEHPSLVLLDVSMPKLDGWETCRLIREVSDVPIIMLTGRDEETDKARGLDLGADRISLARAYAETCRHGNDP